jgi:stalled ribosome rescue protein Dom34
LVKICLELGQIVSSTEERQVLANNGGLHNKVSIKTMADSIEQTIWDKLFEYEGTTTSVESRNTKGRKAKTHIDIGTRIRSYKTFMKNILKTKVDLPLMDCADMIRQGNQEGTPPGVASGRSFWRTREK